MSFVAVAIGGSALVGAGATLLSSSKAAHAQEAAASQATQLQQQQLTEAQRQYDLGRSDLAPWRDAGTAALSDLTKMTSGDPAVEQAQVEADPGYQFRLDQGTRGVEASAAARGGVLSGGTQKALARYNQDYASSEFGQRFNRLSALAGIGQSATNTGIAASEANTSTQAAGTNAIASNILGAGNARASQYVAGGNAIGNAAGQVGNYFALKDLTGSGSGGGYTLPSGLLTGQAVQGYVPQGDYTYG